MRENKKKSSEVFLLELVCVTAHHDRGTTWTMKKDRDNRDSHVCVRKVLTFSNRVVCRTNRILAFELVVV